MRKSSQRCGQWIGTTEPSWAASPAVCVVWGGAEPERGSPGADAWPQTPASTQRAPGRAFDPRQDESGCPSSSCDRAVPGRWLQTPPGSLGTGPGACPHPGASPGREERATWSPTLAREGVRDGGWILRKPLSSSARFSPLLWPQPCSAASAKQHPPRLF